MVCIGYNAERQGSFFFVERGNSAPKNSVKSKITNKGESHVNLGQKKRGQEYKSGQIIEARNNIPEIADFDRLLIQFYFNIYIFGFG